MRDLSARLAVSTFFLAGLAALTYAQNPKADKYPALLARLKQGDKTLDFLELRHAFADSPEYTAGSDDDLRKSMFDAYQHQDFKKALELANKLLDGYYLDIEAHQIIYLADRQLHNEAEAEFHHEIAHGLISAIFQTGNCRTREAACEVLSIHEEYVILQVLGLRAGSQSLDSDGVHRYDVLEAVDMKTQETVLLFFNADKPLAYLEKQVGK